MLGNPFYLSVHNRANHNNDSFFNDSTSESAFQRIENGNGFSKSIPKFQMIKKSVLAQFYRKRMASSDT